MSLPSPSISFPPLPPSTSPRDLPPPPPAIPYSHVLLPRFFHSQQSSLAGFRHAPPLQQAAMPDRQPPNLRELNARHEARRSMNTKQGHERSASGTPAHRGSQQPRSASNEGRKKERDKRKKKYNRCPLGIPAADAVALAAIDAAAPPSPSPLSPPQPRCDSNSGHAQKRLPPHPCAAVAAMPPTTWGRRKGSPRGFPTELQQVPHRPPQPPHWTRRQ